jgi:hypothetical protein
MTEGDRRLLDSDASVVMHLFQHNALAELDQLPVPVHALDSRALAIELLLDLLSADAQGLREQITGLICRWCGDSNGWKDCMETAVRLLVSHVYSLLVLVSYPTQVEKAEWSRLTRTLQDVANKVPEEGRKRIISNALPALHMVKFILLVVNLWLT